MNPHYYYYYYFRTSGDYDAFTIFVNHQSLFMGCAYATPSFYSGAKLYAILLFSKMVEVGYEREGDLFDIQCYFAPSEIPGEENILYHQGEPCSQCPFVHLDFKCSEKYPNLCSKCRFQYTYLFRPGAKHF